MPKILRILLLITAIILGNDAFAMQPAADINSVQNQQHFLDAIKRKDVAEVKRYLDAGLVPNFAVGPEYLWYDNNPISAAMTVNSADIMQLLLKRGAHPNTIIDFDGNTALMRALAPVHFESQKIERDRIIKMFVADSQLNINYQNKDGNSSLMLAIRHELPHYISLILARRDLDVNAQDRDGNTPLMLAIIFNRPDVAKILLTDPRIDINIKNNYGETALIKLVQAEWPVEKILPLLTLFLENKSLERSHTDNRGLTAYGYAYKADAKEIMDTFKKYRASTENPERRKMPKGVYEPSQAAPLTTLPVLYPLEAISQQPPRRYRVRTPAPIEQPAAEGSQPSQETILLPLGPLPEPQ